MFVLLPPSEAKRPGGDGAPLGGTAGIGLGSGPLGRGRRAALAALRAALREPPAAVAARLKIPGPPAAALDANRRVTRSPTMPALERYDGILYRALDLRTAPPAARAAVGEAILIFSGLFGVVSGAEAVPFYRVPAAAVLPGVGSLARHWRPTLEAVLPGRFGSEPVVDLRSSDYAAMWTPPPATAAQVVTVRILFERPGGPPRTISYSGKVVKGALTRELLIGPGRLRAGVADAVAEAATRLDISADLLRAPAGQTGVTLTVRRGHPLGPPGG